MKDKFYTLQEIHDRIHTSVPYLKKLIENGTLKAIRISKDYLVSEYDFLKFLEIMEVKKIMSDKEILDLLGLNDRTIKVGVDLEQDLQYVIENGIDKYLKEI